jgi:hypothetical protein
LNGLEDTYKSALVRFGLAAAEDTKRPPLLAPNVRIESTLSLRMQSRIESRVAQGKVTDSSGKVGKKRTDSRRSRGDSLGHD